MFEAQSHLDLQKPVFPSIAGRKIKCWEGDIFFKKAFSAKSHKMLVKIYSI